MIKLADYRTEDAFPSEMKTASRCAAAYAFDQEKKRILEAKKRVLIWASLENVPDDKLDVLAVENRVLFYNSGLDPSIKRQLIQNSIYWYMKLGTRQAMEEMIDISSRTIILRSKNGTHTPAKPSISGSRSEQMFYRLRSRNF